jgi:hypothetical protein
MRKVTEKKERRIQWEMQQSLEYLDFADDICLLAQRVGNMKQKLDRLKSEAEGVGLNINGKKTKDMRRN